VASLFTRLEPVNILLVWNVKNKLNCAIKILALKTICKKHSGCNVFSVTSRNLRCNEEDALLDVKCNCKPKETISNIFLKQCE